MLYGETLPWPGGRRGGAGPGRGRGSWWRRCCVAKRQVGAGAGGPPTALLTWAADHCSGAQQPPQPQPVTSNNVVISGHPVTAYLGRALGQHASCIDDNNESKHQSGLKSAENVILCQLYPYFTAADLSFCTNANSS